VGQEFFINSETLESQVRKLLPSQGGAGAGFDLSASTQIIPIIDLTESAEGSNLRSDLQTALSFDQVSSFSVNNGTTTIISNTGYYRVFGVASLNADTATALGYFILNDGASDKIIWQFFAETSSTAGLDSLQFDFNVFLSAGDILKVVAGSPNSRMIGCTRQIASIDGTLVNP
jgi:hypothetical protein